MEMNFIERTQKQIDDIFANINDDVKSLMDENDFEISSISNLFNDSYQNLLTSSSDIMNMVEDTEEILNDQKINSKDIFEENKKLKERVQLLEKTIYDNNKSIKSYIGTIAVEIPKIENEIDAIVACHNTFEITALNVIEELSKNINTPNVIVQQNINTNNIYDTLTKIYHKVSYIEDRI